MREEGEAAVMVVLLEKEGMRLQPLSGEAEDSDQEKDYLGQRELSPYPLEVHLRVFCTRKKCHGSLVQAL